MGQYVKRDGKTYYKGDDGKLYSDFQAANQARIGRSPEAQLIGGIGDILRETFIGTARKAKAEPGAQADPSLLARVWAPFGSVPIRTGLDEAGNVDRRKSDEYKQFAMTQEGQFDRYFKTPEFDYVFGAQTGKGPKTAAEMAGLATQTKAPTTAPLADYYRSQSAMGRVNQAEIQKMYADRPDLQKWAAANPMLAQREFVKRQGGRPLAPDQETVMGDLGSRAQAETGYTPEAFGMPANPVPPTQQPGPGGMDQGTRVSYFRGSENIAPLQAMKTTGEGMPGFQTTLGKAEEFLKGYGK